MATAQIVRNIYYKPIPRVIPFCPKLATIHHHRFGFSFKRIQSALELAHVPLSPSIVIYV